MFVIINIILIWGIKIWRFVWRKSYGVNLTLRRWNRYKFVFSWFSVWLSCFGLVWFVVFNATFNNISIISWRILFCAFGFLAPKNFMLFSFQRFFPGIWSVSSTNKTDRHDITEILLKVALNTKTLTPNIVAFLMMVIPETRRAH